MMTQHKNIPSGIPNAFQYIPNVIQKLAFGAARKSPRIDDRKRPNIKSIWGRLRSSIPKVLACSKRQFLNHVRYKPLCFFCLISTLLFQLIVFSSLQAKEGLPLYYWQQNRFVNFGDYLSLKLVERIVGTDVEVVTKPHKNDKIKLLAIGSLLYFATQNDVLWGTGFNGKIKDLDLYKFTQLDVRAVRGPLTRKFLMDNFNVECPEIYGDPALLTPYFFPEFQRPEHPSMDYIVILHYSEEKLFPKDLQGHIVYPTEPWDVVIQKIVDSQFVISSSLHGLIVAEAFGIPARMLRITENEPLIKYQDYYLGTHRPDFKYASSIEEALKMGGEPPFECDLDLLYQAFPFEFWPNLEHKHLMDNHR